MDGNQPISWLMFFTLAAGVVIVGLAMINFLRSRSNRAVAADTLAGDGSSRGAAPDGALPELAGVTAFALIAMGLLAFGFNSQSGTQTAQVVPAASSTTTTGMAQSPSQNAPKRYQPQNPAPDTRAAPTASSAGIGASNGETK